MSGLGTPELIFIGILVLIVILGPRRASGILRALGRARRDLYRGSGEIEVPIKEVVVQVSDPKAPPQSSGSDSNEKGNPIRDSMQERLETTSDKSRESDDERK